MLIITAEIERQLQSYCVSQSVVFRTQLWVPGRRAACPAQCASPRSPPGRPRLPGEVSLPHWAGRWRGAGHYLLTNTSSASPARWLQTEPHGDAEPAWVLPSGASCPLGPGCGSPSIPCRPAGLQEAPHGLTGSTRCSRTHRVACGRLSRSHVYNGSLSPSLSSGARMWDTHSHTHSHAHSGLAISFIFY